MAEEQQANGKRDVLWKAFLWVSAVLVSINISVIGYVVSLILDLQLRITRIEANRFTNGDGSRIYEAIADLEKRIAQLPKDIPPLWFKEYVYENRSRLKALENKQR